ncbi:MAG: sugar fermentation stimulation protein SfsA [Gammaproteobacteria bacterium MedPE]|nr:MAG: sugar fermentation stimulation protein SfsA [Gammaproteobacteria bacterium MedPE]
MQFKTPLNKARLIKRYKRFLADVVLEDGSETTIHVANTGAMTGCAEPDDWVWYSTSPNPKRKYPFSWELTQTKTDHFICVNTMQANTLAEEAIENKTISELTGYGQLKREVKYGDENSKIDVLLSDNNKVDCFVEVKSVTLYRENGKGAFPDAVTTRGQKHLRELMAISHAGNRAVLLFIVLHSGIETVTCAKDIDPKYAQLLEQAVASGVEVLAYGCSMSNESLVVNRSLPVLI